MKKKNSFAVLALAALAWTPAQARAATNFVPLIPVCLDCRVSNLTFDHAMLFNLVNSAIQNNGVINNFNAGANAGVVSLSIHNSGPVPAYCFLIPSVKQAGNGVYNCYPQPGPGGNVAVGPLLQTTSEIPAGQTVQVNIGGLELAPNGNGGNYNGGFCANLQNLINNNFGGNNSNSGGNGGGGGSNNSNALSAAGTVVQELLQLQLSICVSVANSSDAVVGNEACTNQPIGVFATPPSVNTQSAILIYPNNATIATGIPSFVWTPSLYKGSSLGLSYELVLSESENGNPWYSVQIPSGQSYYQYQSTDRALTAGQQYWWHVVTYVTASLQPVGGQNGQGWNQPQATFTYKATGALGAAAPVVTLQEISQLVLKNASPAVLQALSGMQIQGASPFGVLSDPDLGALLLKPAEIKNISVEKF